MLEWLGLTAPQAFLACLVGCIIGRAIIQGRRLSRLEKKMETTHSTMTALSNICSSLHERIMQLERLDLDDEYEVMR